MKIFEFIFPKIMLTIMGVCIYYCGLKGDILLALLGISNLWVIDTFRS